MLKYPRVGCRGDWLSSDGPPRVESMYKTANYNVKLTNTVLLSSRLP